MEEGKQSDNIDQTKWFTFAKLLYKYENLDQICKYSENSNKELYISFNECHSDIIKLIPGFKERNSYPLKYLFKKICEITLDPKELFRLINLMIDIRKNSELNILNDNDKCIKADRNILIPFKDIKLYDASKNDPVHLDVLRTEAASDYWLWSKNKINNQLKFQQLAERVIEIESKLDQLIELLKSDKKN
jgi:hypothetical protein